MRNCSESIHLNDSVCNLASINLLKFLDDDRFDVDAFRHTVEVVLTAQEILVGRADYPTEKIAETSYAFRQLGLGYTNLGATLMALGLPYDSEAGRAWAGALTSLMGGQAYATSARTAAQMAPFAGFAANEEHMLRVLRMHREASRRIEGLDLLPPYVARAAQEAWDAAVRDGEEFGVRNSQATVLAPTGTISFMMDADTTGIEPELGLVKTKKLVGGGTMSIVNGTCHVPSPISGTTSGRSPTSSLTSTPKRRSSGRPTWSPGTWPCSPARWATTRSTTKATCG